MFDDTLLRILEKEVEKEKWSKKARIKGTVINKRFTRKGSIMLTIRAKKYEYDIVVPKHREIEFEVAQHIKEKDFVSIIGEKAINVVFCERIELLNKDSSKQKQMKLVI